MKPRLAENVDDLYRKVVELTESGVVTDRGILYPVVRIPLMGDYSIREAGIYKMSNGGMCIVEVRQREKDEVHAELERDRADVVLMTRWGGSGGSVESKAYEVLHSASGFSFMNKEQIEEYLKTLI